MVRYPTAIPYWPAAPPPDHTACGLNTRGGMRDGAVGVKCLILEGGRRFGLRERTGQEGAWDCTYGGFAHTQPRLRHGNGETTGVMNYEMWRKAHSDRCWCSI